MPRRQRKKPRHRISLGSGMEEYADRNALLEDFGFKNYQAYLRGGLWKSIRRDKLGVDPECYGCGKKRNLQVHHGKYTYDNLAGISAEHLYTVCRRCHLWCEISKDWIKRSPSQATLELFRIRLARISLTSSSKK